MHAPPITGNKSWRRSFKTSRLEAILTIVLERDGTISAFITAPRARRRQLCKVSLVLMWPVLRGDTTSSVCVWVDTNRVG